jgi:ketosteroid isomerase-like protein
MNDSTKQTNRAIDAFLASINAGDFEAFAACLAPDVHFEMVGSTVLSGVAEGREAMLAVVGRVGDYVDENFIHLEEIDRVVAGNRGTLRTRGTAHTRDGRPYNNTYLHLFRVEAGQFVEFIEYLDTDLINRVLVDG